MSTNRSISRLVSVFLIVIFMLTPVVHARADIDGASFAAKVDFSAGSYALGIAISDLDGDGKPELVSTSYTGNTVSVLFNTSTSGTINASSFSSSVGFSTGSFPYGVAIGDLDGDGKPDLAVTSSGSNAVSVFRNISTTGVIDASSFDSRVDFGTGSSPYGIAIGDLDGDGKLDLAVANINSNTVSVLRNTSTIGTIDASSFSAKVDFGTGFLSGSRSIEIGDLDGDGKPELVVANSNTPTVSVFRNTTTSGTINASSFAAKVDFGTGANAFSVAISDLDGDSKPDMAVANYYDNTISVLRNTSTSGMIDVSSFAVKVDFGTGSSPRGVAIRDLDGDNKPDLAVANSGSSVASVLRNTSTSGMIDTSSFAAKVDFNAGSPLLVAIGDLDGDGKPEMAAVSSGNNISVLRNTTIPPLPSTRYVATTGADAGDCGNSASPCATITYAISQAVAGNTIEIAAGTYTEAGISIDKDLTLTGASASSTIVQAATSPGTATNRVFFINTGVTVIIEGMTIQNGKTTHGGGIMIYGSLTMNHSTVSNNSAGGYGGGIHNYGGTLDVNNSIVNGNSADSGGGIFNAGGAATLNNSTISGNSASNGSGISNEFSGTLTLNNSTISGNSAISSGGGIFNNHTSTATLNYSTVVDNTSNSDNNAFGNGGGIHNGSGTVNLKNSIVAGSKNGTGGVSDVNADCGGPITIATYGFNLTGTGTGCNLSGPGDVTVTPANVFTDVLGTLANNGGSTQTHALIISFSNPALNAIPNGTNDCGIALFDLDQRGEARPFNTNCDIGAYEAQSAPAATTELTITANDQTKTYGDSDPASFTFTYSGFVNGYDQTNIDTPPTCSVTVAHDNVGTYPIVCSGGADDNYTFNYVDGTLTVAQKALTITADNQGKVFGTTLTFLGTEFTTNGLIFSDTVTSVALFSPGAPASAAVGTYSIVSSAAIGSGLSNYAITYVNGLLTVGINILTITANDQAKTYGDGFTFAGTEFTVVGLLPGDSVTSVTLTSAGAPSSAAVGAYSIVASAAVGTGLSNYTIVYVNGQMDVDPQFLVVTPDDKTKIYGDMFTAFTGTITGIQPGDNITANYASTGAPATAAVGTYPITATLNAPSDVLSNYNVILNNGSLTITQHNLVVTPDDKVKVYGDVFTAFTGTITGIQNGDPITATYTSPGAPTVAAVGNYPITATLVDPSNKLDNYNVILNMGALTVDSAMLTVTADDQSIVYGDLDPSFTFTYSGFVAADTSADIDTPPSCTVAGPHTDVGTYPIACSGGFDNSYNFNYVDGTLTILSNVPDLLTPADAEQLLNNRPTFDWTDVSGALSYTIQISNNIGFTGTPTSNTVTDSTYTQPTNLPNNVTRYWRVQAIRAGGPGPWSEIRSFVTARPPSAPGLASPGNNALVTDYTPLLNWNNSSVPAGTTFQKYELQIATDSAFTSPTSVDVSGLVTDSDYTPSTDLDSNTTYYWRVRAFNTLGQYSAWSNVRNFRTALVPPTLVTPIEAEQMLVNRPTFEWDDVSGADEYRIQISNNIGFTSTLTNTTIATSTYTRTTDLPFGVTLYWRVRSDGVNGPSGWSEVWSLITTNPPSVPTLSAPGNNTKVSGPSPLFNWNDSTLPAGVDFDHYQIQIATSNAFTTIVHDNNLAGITNSQDNTAVLLPATTYYWRVRAFNMLGHASAWSNVRSIRIRFAGPTLTSPTTGSTVSSLAPTFTWEPISGAATYRIQISTDNMFSTGTIEINKTGITVTTFTPTSNLTAGTTYYWRVPPIPTHPVIGQRCSLSQHHKPSQYS